MKKPDINNLRFNEEETNRIKSKLNPRKVIKVTINIEAQVLRRIKSISDDTGVPYQRLINKLLDERLGSKLAEEKRLDKIEAELEEIKRKIAA